MTIKRCLFSLVLSMVFFSFSFAGAEIKIFEREVEEAGTYISSLTVVLNHQLQKDEVTALASGVVQAKIVGIPAVRVENGVVHVKVKARIEVDTSILDRQIQEIMKEKGTLKRLEEEQKKVRELEDKLANLKSSEVIVAMEPKR